MLFCCPSHNSSELGFLQHILGVVSVFAVLSPSLFPVLFFKARARSLTFSEGINIWIFIFIHMQFFSLQFFPWCAAQTVSFSMKHHPPVLCTPSNFASAFAAQKQNKTFVMNCHCAVWDSRWSFPYYYFPKFSFPAQIPRTPLLFGLEWQKENGVMKSKSTFKLPCCTMGSISDCISCSLPATAESLIRHNHLIPWENRTT